MLPEISLGLWHNFGDVDTFSNSQRMAHYAFDKGITTSTWQIITVRLMARQKKPSEKL